MHGEHGGLLADPHVWEAIGFLIFVGLAVKLGWGRVVAMLDARGTRIAAELDEAKRLRAEAEALLRQAEADRAAALAEAGQLLTRAKAEAERLAIAAAAEAEAAAKRRERMALDRIAAAEAGAIADVRNAAALIATAAATRVIAEGMTAEADAALIDRAVAELPTALRAA
jgi:F-type H+-transporting ATPase subunit b